MFHTPLDAGWSLMGVAYGAAMTAVIVLVVTPVALFQTLRQSTISALRYE